MYQQPVRTASGLPLFPWKGRVDQLPSAFRKIVGGRTYRLLRSSYGVAKHELGTHTGLPIGRKLAMWRHGFFAESAVIYDLPRNDLADYVSDFIHSRQLREVNAQNELFTHKLALRSLLLATGFPQPETLAVIYDGRVLLDPFEEGAGYVAPEILAARLAREDAEFIVKPEDGSCGERLFLLLARGGALFRRRGREAEPFDMAAYVAELEASDGPLRMTLVERRLRQGAFWARLFPDSANTIRVLTLWHPDEPAPFVARAVQRVGTVDTVPTDNWSGGGISVPVDLATGTLGVGRMHPLKGGRTEDRFTRHPDTGTQITGVTLPCWPAIHATALRAAASIPFNRMAGWDVLVTDDGTPMLLEANGNSDVNLLQVHGGLLAEPRIRSFYQSVGAL